MSKNGGLHAAKSARNDEFYTRLADIERELAYYKNHFRGKTVLCNCDNPAYSDFWRYFHLNFEFLGLKRLVATYHDAGLPVCKMVYNGGFDGHVEVGVRTDLTGDGDFRSPECVELLDEADVVVTNPPFSLFREYVAQLMEHGKKFLIIGNINAVTYKDFFPLLQSGKVWAGRSFNVSMSFRVPDGYDAAVETDEGRFATVGGICWFTNLEHDGQHESLKLFRTYNQDDYPKYENYDAIEVGRTADIPMDYDGLMGVPVSFLGKHCPEQFELVWKAFGNTRATTPAGMLDALGYRHHKEDRGGLGIVDGRRVYARLLIRRKA